ncbi:MAG: hypothetical protein AAF809_01140, partial [Bacteroidota bacterium]
LLAPSLRPAGTLALTPTDVETGSETDFGYRFYDVHTKLTWRPSRWHRFAATAYAGGDRLEADTPLSDLLDDPVADADARVGLRWGNVLLSGRYDYLYGRTFFITTTLYHTAYRTREDAFAPASADAPLDPLLDSAYRVRFSETGLRADADYFLSLAHQLRAGIEVGYRVFDSNLDERIQRAGPAGPRTETRTGGSRVTAIEAVAYAEDRWQASRRWQVRPGVRLGLYGPAGDVFVSPRVYARYAREEDGFFAQVGVSRQVQTLHRLRDRYATGYDLAANRWLPAGGRVEPATGWQLAAGVGWRPVAWLSLGLDLYVRRFDDTLLPVAEGEVENGIGQRGTDLGALVDDYAAGQQRGLGAELAVQVEQGTWDVGASYTLSQTDERLPGAAWRTARYDLPHSLQVLVQRQVARWSFALTGTARSGLPVTRAEFGVAADTPFTGRLPAYLRLDAAVSVRFPLLGLDWSAQAQAYNLTARRNVVDLRREADGTVRQVEGLSVIPMLTLRARW